MEELKSQTNVSKIPISSNLPFDNDVNDHKQTNILKNTRLKQPKKVCLSRINPLMLSVHICGRLLNSNISRNTAI